MLARFEQLMEQAVEGSLRRVFPTTLQPVQLAKAAARAMDEAQVLGIQGPEVPNRYRVRLAAVDLARFQGYAPTLTRELARYLVEYAAERGLHPIGPPTVELAADPRVRVGTVRADAEFVDVAPARQTELASAIDGTRQLRLTDLAAARPAGAPAATATLWLVDRLGLSFQLEPDLRLVRVGRASDNDVALLSQRVSRYHAQLRWIETSWLLYDLHSTNGTFVDTDRVAPDQPRAVGAGVAFRLADHELFLRGSAPAAG
jgi:hypothetical protein